MKIRIIGNSLVVAAIAWSGCSRQNPQAPSQSAPPPPKVTVAAVQSQEIVEWEEFTGRTEALETVEVRPRVSGHIQEVRFQSGQMVKKGDILFVIDNRWHQAEFNRREAEYQQARARLENAEREAKRTESLLANKAISTEEAEGRLSRFTEAKAGLQAAEAARNFAQLDLEFTEIRSPIDGKASRAIVTPGNFVSGMAGNATLLTTIVTVDPVYVYADIDENSLLKYNALTRDNKIQSGAEGRIPVQLKLGDDGDFTHQGYIESFDNRLDPGTGSILLRAVFPNKDLRIVPGLFARIRVPLSGRYSAVTIEERSIGTDQGQKFVLTLSPTNTVQYRQVVLGPVFEGKRVVRTGLKAGEEIVINGIQRVRPGMPVIAERAGDEKRVQTARN